MARFFTYASIEDRDLAVTLKSNSSGGRDEECYLQDLLIRASHEPTSRFIIAIDYEHYIFHVVRVIETSMLEVEDAVTVLDGFVRSGSGASISTFYKTENDLSDSREKTLTHSYLATLSHARGPFFDSLSLPTPDLELLESPPNVPSKQRIANAVNQALCRLRNAWHDRITVRVLFWIIIGALCIFAAVMVHGSFDKFFYQHFEHGIWVRYNLKAVKVRSTSFNLPTTMPQAGQPKPRIRMANGHFESTTKP